MSTPLSTRGALTSAMVVVAFVVGCATGVGERATLPAVASAMPPVATAGNIRIVADLVVDSEREEQVFGGRVTTRGVVPIMLSIENQGPFPIVVAGRDCVLELWDKTPLTSAGVGEVAVQILDTAHSGGRNLADDPVAIILAGAVQGTAALWLPPLVVAGIGRAAYCAAADCPSPHEAVTRGLQRIALPEPVSVATGQSAKGFVFFFAYPPMWQHSKLRIPVYRAVPQQAAAADLVITVPIP